MHDIDRTFKKKKFLHFLFLQNEVSLHRKPLTKMNAPKKTTDQKVQIFYRSNNYGWFSYWIL
jgi:hypothetical protein